MSERAAWWTLGALCLLFLVPLWWPAHLPFVDYPCRADDLYILSRLGEPDSGFDRWYLVDRWLHPKMAYRLLLLPFAKGFGADAALRGYLSLYLVGAPLAAAFALRQGGRSAWPALLLFPGLYSFPLAYGFGTYSVSTAALLLTYGCWERWRDGLTLRRWLGLFALSALLFLLHPQAWLFWVVTGGALACVAWLSGRQGPRYVAALLTSFLSGVPLLWSYVSFAFNYEIDPTRSRTFVWNPGPVHRLKELPGHLGAYWDDALAPLLLAGFFALVAVVAWAQLRGGSDDPWRDRLWRARWSVVLLAFVGGAFAIPEVFGAQHFVASRFPSMAVLVLPLALGSSAAWGWPPVRRAATLLAVLCGVALVGRMAVFDAESERLAEVAEQIPQDSTMQCNIDLRWTAVHDLPAYDCACAWVHMKRGGLSGHLPHRTGVNHIPELDIPSREYGSWVDAPSEGFHYNTWGNHYRWWIVRDEPGETALDREPLAPYFERTWQSGPWRIYRRTKDFIGDGP